MEIKESIKKWLKENGKDRFWLAEKFEVDKRTVDSWFFKKTDLPSKVVLFFKDILEEVELSPEEKEYHVLNGMVAIAVPFTIEEIGLIKCAALREGVSVEEFIRTATNECVNADYPSANHNGYEDAKKNPPGEKSAGKDGADGNVPKPGLSPDRRYLRAAKLDESETA